MEINMQKLPLHSKLVNVASSLLKVLLQCIWIVKKSKNANKTNTSAIRQIWTLYFDCRIIAFFVVSALPVHNGTSFFRIYFKSTWFYKKPYSHMWFSSPKDEWGSEPPALTLGVPMACTFKECLKGKRMLLPHLFALLSFIFLRYKFCFFSKYPS